MSKIIVYWLDKFVWLILVAVFSLQILQIAGFVESPKDFGDISYSQDKEFKYQLVVDEGDVRGKRQATDRSEFIDTLFNISSSEDSKRRRKAS